MGSPAKNQTFALDEELWFGDHDDADAENRAAASLAAVGARIVGAKPFPVAARRLDELTRNPNTRIEQVVNVLESDPALSARLLRLVNSAGYGLKVRCTSVRHAAVLVGTRRLNQVATTAAILDLFDANNAHAMELLEHAAVVGSLCRYLAVHQGLPHDELFTCGFLHDIGKLMLLDAERDRYAELLNEFGHAPDQIHLAERKLFGFDHAVLGAHVLTAWNIPEPVPRVIAWHHAPARAMQDTVVSAMVQTLRLADLLAYVLALPDAEQAVALAAASEAANYLEVSDVQLAAMWNDLVALRDRSRARSHGEPELEVMVPKVEVPSLRARASLSPSQKPSKSTGRPLHEVPSHFPCSVCAKPSFGNVCAACGGHVCPSHQVGSDEWCSVCAREYVRFKKTAELSGALRAFVGTLVGSTLAVALYSASRAPDAGLETLILAPVLVLALWAVVLPVAYRLWQKLAFLERRRKSKRAEPSAAIARPRVLHIPSAASASAFLAANAVDAAAPSPPQASAASSSIDGQDGPDSPLSMAPLSTAPSVPPALSPALSSPPRSSRSVPRLAVEPAAEAPAPESVAPPMLSVPQAASRMLPGSMTPESLLPDSEFISVRPTTVSIALAAHFGRKPSQHPSVGSRAPHADDDVHAGHPERSPLVSERPRLAVSDSILDGLPLAPPEPVRIREVAAASVAPAVPTAAPASIAAPSVLPVASAAPPVASPSMPAPVASAAPPVASPSMPAPVASMPAPVASMPTPVASIPAPHISVGPPTMLSFAPDGSLPPTAPSVHPYPEAVSVSAPQPSVHPVPNVSLPAPHISMGPPEHVSLPPDASIPPSAFGVARLDSMSAPPATSLSAPPATSLSAPPATSLSAPPATSLSAPPAVALSARPEAALANEAMPPEALAAPPEALAEPPSEVVPVQPPAPSLSVQPARVEATDETPDSGAQLVVQPPTPRVYNSPLSRGAASGCVRVSLQACVGASGPKISYRPPGVAVPGSRESA